MSLGNTPQRPQPGGIANLMGGAGAPKPQGGPAPAPGGGGGGGSIGSLEEQIGARADQYRGNPNALKQRYGQNKQLVDLLALQRLQTQLADTKRQVQMEMDTNPATIMQQKEQALMQEIQGDTQGEFTKKAGETMGQQARVAQAKQRQAPQQAAQAAAGIQQLMAQGGGAQRPQGMAKGGIIGLAGQGPSQRVSANMVTAEERRKWREAHPEEARGLSDTEINQRVAAEMPAEPGIRDLVNVEADTAGGFAEGLGQAEQIAVDTGMIGGIGQKPTNPEDAHTNAINNANTELRREDAMNAGIASVGKHRGVVDTAKANDQSQRIDSWFAGGAQFDPMNPHANPLGQAGAARLATEQAQDTANVAMSKDIVGMERNVWTDDTDRGKASLTEGANARRDATNLQIQMSDAATRLGAEGVRAAVAAADRAVEVNKGNIEKDIADRTYRFGVRAEELKLEVQHAQQATADTNANTNQYNAQTDRLKAWQSVVQSGNAKLADMNQAIAELEADILKDNTAYMAAVNGGNESEAAVHRDAARVQAGRMYAQTQVDVNGEQQTLYSIEEQIKEGIAQAQRQVDSFARGADGFNITGVTSGGAEGGDEGGAGDDLNSIINPGNPNATNASEDDIANTMNNLDNPPNFDDLFDQTDSNNLGDTGSGAGDARTQAIADIRAGGTLNREEAGFLDAIDAYSNNTEVREAETRRGRETSRGTNINSTGYRASQAAHSADRHAVGEAFAKLNTEEKAYMLQRAPQLRSMVEEALKNTPVREDGRPQPHRAETGLRMDIDGNVYPIETRDNLSE